MSAVKQPKMTSTRYRIVSDHEYPFLQTGVIIHREGLSDLGEPYLSAVKEARAERDRARGRNG